MAVFAALILVRKASPQASPAVVQPAEPPPNAGWTTPAVVGKSAESVPPETYTLPAGSSAMPTPLSSPVPPKYVEKTNAVPVGFNSDTNASPQIETCVAGHAILPPANAA